MLDFVYLYKTDFSYNHIIINKKTTFQAELLFFK